jgi:transcriptional regulator with XRE-family HTH domain
MYKDARKAAGLSIDEAAFRVNVASRTLCNYESGKNTPEPDVVLGMSREYRKPEMIQEYCRENCAIGRTYGYEVLNAIDTNPSAVLMKLLNKLEDSHPELKSLARILVNKRTRDDFTDCEWVDLSGAAQKLFDIEHNISILRMVFVALDQKAAEELVAEHNQKCWQKGYARKETRPLVTAAR